MLWRESYSPVVSREAVRTPFSDETLAFVGSLSFEASREVEVWWRLFEEDFPGVITEVLPESCRSEVIALRAPSRQFRIRFDSDAVKLPGDYSRQQAFCAVVRNGIAELIVTGPPTEDAWDEVSSLWRSIRT